MKRLYHGSDTEISVIDLSLCRPGKDFGRGFYLTEDHQKAMRMARRTALINGTTPKVNEYECEEFTDRGLKVKTFYKPSAEWAEFIYNNREVGSFHHEYDIVVGPTADDGLKRRLLEFDHEHQNFTDLASAIKYREEDKQYCFCTEIALKLLKKK